MGLALKDGSKQVASIRKQGSFFLYRIEKFFELMLLPELTGGARVVQIGGGTRELYYYPKGTVQVTYVGKKVAKGMFIRFSMFFYMKA